MQANPPPNAPPFNLIPAVVSSYGGWHPAFAQWWGDGPGCGGTSWTDGLSPRNALAIGRVPLGGTPAATLPGLGWIHPEFGVPGAWPVGTTTLRGPRVLESGSRSCSALGWRGTRVPAVAARRFAGSGKPGPRARPPAPEVPGMCGRPASGCELRR